jgi:hypothetical protein
MFTRKHKLFRLSGFEVGIDPSWILLAFPVAWPLPTGYFPFKLYPVVDDGHLAGCISTRHLKGIIALKDLLNFLSMKIELEEEAA